MNRLPIQEVIRNLDAAITNPDRIPSRTTFELSQLNFSDTGGLAATLPLNTLGRSAGALTVKAPEYNDQYQLGVSAESDPEALRALRNLYREGVYPGDHIPITRFGKIYQKRWLFWEELSIDPEYSKYTKDGLFFIGSGDNYNLYVRDRTTFSEFVLSSFGSHPPLPARSLLARAPALRGTTPTRETRRRPADLERRSTPRVDASPRPRTVPPPSEVEPRSSPPTGGAVIPPRRAQPPLAPSFSAPRM